MPESFLFFGKDPLNLIRIMPAQGFGKLQTKETVSPGMRFFYFMRLTINGENKDVQAETLKALLVELGITEGRVAVEVNMEIVRKADYEGFRIKDGDVLEIVNFVGGGSERLPCEGECTWKINW